MEDRKLVFPANIYTESTQRKANGQQRHHASEQFNLLTPLTNRVVISSITRRTRLSLKNWLISWKSFFVLLLYKKLLMNSSQKNQPGFTTKFLRLQLIPPIWPKRLWAPRFRSPGTWDVLLIWVCSYHSSLYSGHFFNSTIYEAHAAIIKQCFLTK